MISYYILTVVAVLLFAAALSGLAWAERQYHEIRLEALHSKLFALRGKVYLAAADGVLTPGAPGLRHVIDIINSLIRGGKRLGIDSMISARSSQGGRAELENLFYEGLDDEGRAFVDGILKEAIEVLVEIWALNSNLARFLLAIERLNLRLDGRLAAKAESDKKDADLRGKAFKFSENVLKGRPRAAGGFRELALT